MFIINRTSFIQFRLVSRNYLSLIMATSKQTNNNCILLFSEVSFSPIMEVFGSGEGSIFPLNILYKTQRNSHISHQTQAFYWLFYHLKSHLLARSTKPYLPNKVYQKNHTRNRLNEKFMTNSHWIWR